MPNLRNYVSTETSRFGPKYTVSRIIVDKQDNLLSMEMPANFPTEIQDNNIELHLYSLADNSLVYSTYIKNERGVISIKRLQYEDNTLRSLLFIDLAKIPAISVELPPGRFQATIHFLMNEFGSYDNRVLNVTRISNSRNEVELKLNSRNLELLGKLDEFAQPRIPKDYIFPTLVQIFNQEGADQLSLPMSSAKIDSSSIYQGFASGSGQKLVDYNFDDDSEDGSRPGINTITQNTLDIAYPLAVTAVEEAILKFNSSSFTETEILNIVVSSIDTAYDSILDDEQKNPEKYRFDLI